MAGTGHHKHTQLENFIKQTNKQTNKKNQREMCDKMYQIRHSLDRLHSWKETEQEFSSKLKDSDWGTEHSLT